MAAQSRVASQGSSGVEILPSGKVHTEPYKDGGFAPDWWPTLGGEFAEQDYEHESDGYDVRGGEEERDALLRDGYFLRWDGPVSAESPVPEDRLKLCPLEVVFDSRVIDNLRDLAIDACRTGRREVMGWFGGRLCRDELGRCWTHITEQRSDPELVGEPDRVHASVDIVGKLRHVIRQSGLVVCGFWHSHPGYEPFLSDDRASRLGRDVQSTIHHCKQWWEVSAVIDPFNGGDALVPVDDRMMVGCFKPTFADPNAMSFRPIAFGVADTEIAEQ